jgi:hypothetical protein
MKSLFSVDKNRLMGESVIHRINLALMLLCLASLFYISSTRIFIADSGITSNEPAKRDYCALVMKQMINKKLSPKLMEEGLYQKVVSDGYSALFFEGKEKISGVWAGKKTCKILISGTTPRSFNFFLTGSSSLPFYYQVTKIREHELFEKEER